MNSINIRADKRTTPASRDRAMHRPAPAPSVTFSAMLPTLELRRLVAAMVD